MELYTNNVLLLLIKCKVGEQTEGVYNIKMVVFWKGKKGLHAYYSHGCLAHAHAM